MTTICVIGAGYVGLVTAACLADLGNQVQVVDIDSDRIEGLRAAVLPFHEPGLREVVLRAEEGGRLRFTTDYRDALSGVEFAFIAVSTPEGEAGECDLTAVEQAAVSIAGAATGPLVVVNKSTVPIGTGDRVRALMEEPGLLRHHVDVISNPEFLREGSAVYDFMHPDRIVIGAHDRCVAERLSALYQVLGAPILVTDLYTAEMIKYASNAFLATRISFINEIARICERVGADVMEVAEGMGLDRRIGRAFLSAGAGFGGSCFPKDVKALRALATRFGYHPELLKAVLDVNDDQRRLIVDKVAAEVGDLAGATVALFGLAFKPDTDDVRDAPSLEIARILLLRGANVRAYDPAASGRARAQLPEVEYTSSPYEAAAGADAVVLVTEWNEFRSVDLPRLLRSMRRPILVDGRNLYDPAQMREMGFTYSAIGR
jgi:UDPglucose 6-dehydrogenase